MNETYGSVSRVRRALTPALFLLALSTTQALSCGQVEEEPPDTETKSEQIEELPPIAARGTLLWYQDILFLLDGPERPSWLFELTEQDEVSFKLSGRGSGFDVSAQLLRWNAAEGDWDEVTWLEARADARQEMHLERALDDGYYWLVIDGEVDGAPVPFSLTATCASGECMEIDLSFAPDVPKQGAVTDPDFFDAEADAIGLSDDFRAWLEDNGYGEHDFARAELAGGSYGGRLRTGDQVMREPVIFIHGNGDRALGGPLGGWSASLERFRKEGYEPQELYAITWGDAAPTLAAYQYHSTENVARIRAFIEAVLAYTGARKVDIVSHSMGVTLTRRAILGGEFEDLLSEEASALGAPLTDRIDSFVGIAGANRGLLSCGLAGPTLPTCSMGNGLYPGMYFGRSGRARLLKELDEQERFEGKFIASIWSRRDELLDSIGGGTLIWGVPTARIEGQDDELVLERESHLESRDLTIEQQLEFVRDHALTPR